MEYKFIGFLNTQDFFFDELNSVKYEVSKTPLDKNLIQNIINYLHKGKNFYGVMSTYYDGTERIGHMDFYTDGIWIWTEYFPYFLKKNPNIAIDESFISHISSNNFQVNGISEEHLNDVLQYFFNYFANEKKKLIDDKVERKRENM
jgi:hypothetical protein